MERVFLSRCESYREEELLPLIDSAFRELGAYDGIRPGMTVVVKPNLILRTKPEDAAVTHPAFTAAVGKCVKKAGGKVLIAESSGGLFTPAAMKAVFKGCGYTEMAEAYGFQLYTECRSREVSLPDGVRCRRMSMAEPFIGAEYLIDLAKLKTHSMVGFSGAVKNLFGTVPGLEKPELHCRFPEKEDFSQMLVDICAFLKPDLSFTDGILAMEGNGPTGGKPKHAKVLGASKSPYALDVCMTSLIGIRPEDILMLRYAHERGLGPISPKEIELLGDSLSSLLIPDFLKARASSTDFIRMLPSFMQPLAKRLATPYPRIDVQRCVGCGKCAESCPQKTIAVKNRKAEIDLKKCIHCFCCHEMCPEKAIRIKRLGLFKL